jgi:hypothetical protein
MVPKTYAQRYTFKSCGRTALHVVVHPNRKAMYRAVTDWGWPSKSGRAHCCYKENEKRATIHFSAGCLGSEVVSHESVHAAMWLLRTDGRAKKCRSDEETLAFWTGQIMRAIVNDFYDNGIYK